MGRALCDSPLGDSGKLRYCPSFTSAEPRLSITFSFHDMTSYFSPPPYALQTGGVFVFKHYPIRCVKLRVEFFIGKLFQDRNRSTGIFPVFAKSDNGPAENEYRKTLALGDFPRVLLGYLI